MRLSEHLKLVTLTAGQVICEPGESLEFVYFPTTCTTSLLSQTAEGDSSELGMTGRDGLVGVSLVLGSHSANHRVVVQCAGLAYRMPVGVFQSELVRCRELQQLALCHVQALITQMSQSIVCIGHHSVRERKDILARQTLDQTKTGDGGAGGCLGSRGGSQIGWGCSMPVAAKR